MLKIEMTFYSLWVCFIITESTDEKTEENVGNVIRQLQPCTPWPGLRGELSKYP